MVVKVYISGISGNKEVKKRQQRVLMILDSKNIKYEIIDITEPGKEADKDFMQNNAKCSGGTVSDPNPRSPLPPQVFNDEEYCGDYDKFDLANEVDTLEQFLKLEVPPEEPQEIEVKKSVINGSVEEDNIEKEIIKNNTEDSCDNENETITKEPLPDTVPLKEPSEEKEISEDRLQPEETNDSMNEEKSPIEETNIDTKESSKESSPVTNEDVHKNGVVSSCEQSNEKDIKNLSEALIENEKAVAAE